MDKKKTNINELYGAATMLNLIRKSLKETKAKTPFMPGIDYISEKFEELSNQIHLEIMASFDSSLKNIQENIKKMQSEDVDDANT